MPDQVDYRDQDYQVILDIKPVNVIIKKSDKKPEQKEEEKERISPEPITDIFSYFYLPKPKECHQGILADVKEIVDGLMKESENNDDFYTLLQAIERLFPDTLDSCNRLNNVLNFIRTYKGKIKENLQSTTLSLDVLYEEAKRTGNWTKYLKESERRQNALRNPDRK
jgi:hypothetical protein